MILDIGMAICAYKSNFNCKKTSSRKRRTTRIKLFNLIRDGYILYNKFSEDYFISLAQYFMKKGYPDGLKINHQTEEPLKEFFMKALFSSNPFHAEHLYINREQFNLFEWRDQFELFRETKIKGLNYYRERSGIPIENFTSLSEIYKIIFTKYGKYNEVNEKLKFPFNHCHKKAIWIHGKHCFIEKDHIIYTIVYGYKEDSSSWSISIESEKNENYVDFCLRIYQHYEEIISGSKTVLISKYYGHDEKNFYLSSRFLLKLN